MAGNVQSRGPGFAVIGIAVGLFVGLVEELDEDCMAHDEGPLAGKPICPVQDTTVLGSSPKAEVYSSKTTRSNRRIP